MSVPGVFSPALSRDRGLFRPCGVDRKKVPLASSGGELDKLRYGHTAESHHGDRGEGPADKCHWVHLEGIRLRQKSQSQ